MPLKLPRLGLFLILGALYLLHSPPSQAVPQSAKKFRPVLSLQPRQISSQKEKVSPTINDKAGTNKSSSSRSAKRKKAKVDRFPPVAFESINTLEKFNGRMFDERGRPIKKSIRRFWHLMRCHQTGEVRPISFRLVRNLYRVALHYPGHKIKIYSGFRSRSVSERQGSYHTKGKAIDFTVEGISNRKLRDYLMNTFKPAGIGYYPNSSFVHFDVRDKSIYWVDVSSSGQPSSFLTNPYELRELERRGAKLADIYRRPTKPAVAEQVEREPLEATDSSPAASPSEATPPESIEEVIGADEEEKNSDDATSDAAKLPSKPAI